MEILYLITNSSLFLTILKNWILIKVKVTAGEKPKDIRGKLLILECKNRDDILKS